MKSLTDNSDRIPTPAEKGLKIDYKRIIYWALRYWYIVAVSLSVSLAIAYFKIRYAIRVFPVTASILIKEGEQSAEGRLLYNNPLVSGFRNYYNELYMIKSYPLIEQALEDLNFGVSFYAEGNVLTRETYEYVPVEVKIINNNGVENKSFYFKILSEEEYQLSPVDNEGSQLGEPLEIGFKDTVKVDGIGMVAALQTDRDIKEFINQVFILNYTSPRILAGTYVSKLNASWAEEGAGIVNLSISGTRIKKEIDFLNGLVRRYQQYDLDKKNLAATRTINFISEQLKGISDSLKLVERQLEVFKNKNVVTDLSMEASRLYTKLEAVESQKSELVISRNYYQYLIKYIQQSQNLDQVILPSSMGINDPVLSSLIGKMIDLQLQLKLNTKKENPLVIEGTKKLNQIKSDLVESIVNQETTDKIKIDFIDKQIKDIEKQMNRLPVAEREYISIHRNYSLLENLYIFLLQKRAEAGISQASTTSDIVFVNPPMAGAAIYPKPLSNYIWAVVLGIGLPAIVFILLEVFNTKVQSREDLEKYTRIPFIGGLGRKHSDNNLEVLTSPKSSIAESFRALRSNLSYFIGNKEKAVFLITSSISGEGKSFTSLNLASVLSLSNKKTLIVGADMRKPKLFQDFGLSNEKGLSTYLAGIHTFEEVVKASSYNCLHMVSGGPVPPNPAELLLTDRMTEFIAEAKKKFDYIILDTPPIAIVTDALALIDHADHILFLVRQNYTPKNLLHTVNDFYVTGKLKNISIVLNDIYRSGFGYGYGYGYSYGYGYGYGYGKSKKNGYGYYNES